MLCCPTAHHTGGAAHGVGGMCRWTYSCLDLRLCLAAADLFHDPVHVQAGDYATCALLRCVARQKENVLETTLVTVGVSLMANT